MDSEIENLQTDNGEKRKRKSFVEKKKEQIKEMSKLELAEYKVELAQHQLKQVKAIENGSARKNDTRRKVLYGVAFLAALKEDADGNHKSFADQILDKHITVNYDRKFLGLPLIDKDTNRQS